jgi:cytochrome c oxidase subunit II
MIYLIGILTLVFLGLTIAVIARMQNVLRGVESDAEAEAPVANNGINGAMWMIFLILGTVGGVWSFLATKHEYLPEASSIHGRETDNLFWFSMAIMTLAAFIVNFALFFFAWKYRYKKGTKATFYPENHKLELIWTAIPAVVMALLVFTGWRAWTRIMSEAPANSQVLEIMGKQFAWYARYGGSGDNKLGNYNYKLINSENEMGIDYSDEASFDDIVSTSEMHVEVGKPVLLKIRARDVLHSVFIPHMRVKMDAVPGMPTKFWFTPDKTTDQMRADLGNDKFDYEIACTEVCGRGHFAMRLRLIVEDKASVDKWKAEQKSQLAVILGQSPDFISKIPENLRAKAMKYAPVAPTADSTTVQSEGAATATSASLR